MTCAVSFSKFKYTYTDNLKTKTIHKKTTAMTMLAKIKSPRKKILEPTRSSKRHQNISCTHYFVFVFQCLLYIEPLIAGTGHQNLPNHFRFRWMFIHGNFDGQGVRTGTEILDRIHGGSLRIMHNLKKNADIQKQICQNKITYSRSV